MQNLQWYPGHMAKTRRLIEANLKLIDVVVEILDARIPFSGRNPNFDDIIRNKPRLLVLNKSDLADKNRTKQWIDWYAAQGLKVIPISCSTGMGINTVLNEARALIQDTELLDTPGILPPKFEDQSVAMKLAYTGAIKDEIMNTELLAYSLCEYLRDNYTEALCSRYKLDSVEGLEGYEVLEKIGKKRGFVISGGETDMERAANMVLDELRGAKIGNITLEIPQDIENNEKTSSN